MKTDVRKIEPDADMSQPMRNDKPKPHNCTMCDKRFTTKNIYLSTFESTLNRNHICVISATSVIIIATA